MADSLGLSPRTRQARIKNVCEVYCPRLATPYPPPERDIYETEEIGAIWREHRAGKEHPEMEKLDKEKLALIVEPDQSIIVRDADTKELAAVILRGFCRNDEVLEWITSVVDENVGLRRDIRVCNSLKPNL